MNQQQLYNITGPKLTRNGTSVIQNPTKLPPPVQEGCPSTSWPHVPGQAKQEYRKGQADERLRSKAPGNFRYGGPNGQKLSVSPKGITRDLLPGGRGHYLGKKTEF